MITQLSSPTDCTGRVHKITALGVVVNDQLTSTDHISCLLFSCSSLLYALHVLRYHGLPTSSLHDIFRATVMAKILYCAPAWYGFSSAADCNKLESFLRRCKWTGYCTLYMPTVTEQMNNADDKLFYSVFRNQHHVLQYQYFLDDNPDLVYNLRPRKHNKTLISKTAELNNRKLFIANAIKSGVLQQVTSVSVTNKQCFISSTAAHRPSWRVHLTEDALFNCHILLKNYLLNYLIIHLPIAMRVCH